MNYLYTIVCLITSFPHDFQHFCVMISQQFLDAVQLFVEILLQCLHLCTDYGVERVFHMVERVFLIDVKEIAQQIVDVDAVREEEEVSYDDGGQHCRPPFHL